MENELELKWGRIQQEMQKEGADGCLLAMNMNLYYVSGHVFNGYFYLPSEGQPYWFVKRLTLPENRQLYVVRKPEQIPGLFQELNDSRGRSFWVIAQKLRPRESFSEDAMYSGLNQ